MTPLATVTRKKGKLKNYSSLKRLLPSFFTYPSIIFFNRKNIKIRESVYIL